MPDAPVECVVAVRTASGLLAKAFDIRIVGEDIYVNYSDCSTPEAHSSYHASGQHHIKVGGRFIEWDGGPTGHMEPMRFYRTPPRLVAGRSKCWAIGWEIQKLDGKLPILSGSADMIVDTRTLKGTELILGFEVYVVGDRGDKTRKPDSIAWLPELEEDFGGYRIVASQHFGEAVHVQVDAFVLEDVV